MIRSAVWGTQDGDEVYVECRECGWPHEAPAFYVVAGAPLDELVAVWDEHVAKVHPTNDRKEMDAESERHSRGGDDARGNPGPPRGAVLPTDFSSWDRDRRQDWLMSIGLDDVIADEAEMDRRIIDYLEDNRG